MQTQRRSVYAVGDAGVFKANLGRARKAARDLIPVYQVGAVKDRNSGEKFKAAEDGVIISAIPAQAWIRIKTGDDRIRERTRRVNVVHEKTSVSLLDINVFLHILPPDCFAGYRRFACFLWKIVLSGSGTPGIETDFEIC